MPIPSSELILNDDGSIYHLNLLPGDLATTIITVGDQERVAQVSKHFDHIELKKQKREFTCHTGRIGKKRISVISTGIGTDNIDIVFNEIDALFNINFETREAKEKKTVLDFIRLGTSGSLQNQIPLGSILISEVAVGIDNMNRFYEILNHNADLELQQRLDIHLGDNIKPYTIKANYNLLNTLAAKRTYILGKTLTSIGFYAPQGRTIRGKAKYPNFIEQIAKAGITNLEMETSGIYLLAAHLGHRAVSVNAILANRIKGSFAKEPYKVVDKMIQEVLEDITSE